MDVETLVYALSKHLIRPALAATLLAVMYGCASSTRPPYVDCPANISGYVTGKATSSYVKSCLGLPIREERNPDGRSVAIYYIDQKTRVVFLFDKAGVLVKTSSEKQK